MSETPHTMPSRQEQFANADRSSSATFASTQVDGVEQSCHPELFTVRITLCDDTGEPYAKVPYRITVGELVIEEMTSGTGMVEQDLPSTATTGTLAVWPDGDRSKEPVELTLGIGEMDPLALTSGQESRIENLSFGALNADGTEASALEREAICFRAWAGLGDEDDTQTALGRFYDPFAALDPVDALDGGEPPEEGEA